MVDMNTDLIKDLIITVPVMLYNDCCEGAGANFQSKSELSNALRLYVSNESQAIDAYGKINCWGVGQVTDFSWLFYESKSFNEKISCWTVSGATDMSYMFYGASSFNQDIGQWDILKVEKMDLMFAYSSFNQYIAKWDVSKVQSMYAMFYYASAFNQDISRWNISHVQDFSSMFYGAQKFNQNLCDWLMFFEPIGISASSMFTESGCVFKNDPIFETNENFCQKCELPDERRGMFIQKRLTFTYRLILFAKKHKCWYCFILFMCYCLFYKR